jgi:hypothetical protein
MKNLYIYYDKDGRVRMISEQKLEKAGNLYRLDKKIKKDEEKDLKTGPCIKAVKDGDLLIEKISDKNST